ncbi:MAG: hypothetical protein QMD80_04075 [archaeon]|nr:hypothetical protein [archaeon]
MKSKTPRLTYFFKEAGIELSEEQLKQIIEEENENDRVMWGLELKNDLLSLLILSIMFFTIFLSAERDSGIPMLILAIAFAIYILLFSPSPKWR